MNLPILQSEVKTMSSREIAELCGKEHRGVLRDIDNLNETYEKMGLHKTVQGSYTHPNTGNQQHREYLLTKEQSIDLVTGYNQELRITINRRWAELESQQSQVTLPNFTDPAEAAIAWAKEYKEKQALAIENSVLKPKSDALDVISAASNSLNIRETAKTLDIQEKKFIAWCINHDWLYRDSKAKLCPISHRIQSGFLEQRAVSYIKPNSEVGVSTQAMFTARALTHLAKIFAVVKEVV